MGKRELVALLKLSSGCLVIASVVWLNLTARWVGMQCVNLTFPDHTHILRQQELQLISRSLFLSEMIVKQHLSYDVLSGSDMYTLI